MRFAYIDSQGNEVTIPTEDALRLRIELGAIVEETSFFDGSADRWAPAGEHEVFQRLKRDLSTRDEVAPLAIADLGPETERLDSPPVATRHDAVFGGPPVHRVAPLSKSGGTAPEEIAPTPAEPASPKASPRRADAPSAATPPVQAADPAAAEGGTGAADSEFDFGDFGELDLEKEGQVPARSTSSAPESPALAYELSPAAPDEPEGDPWTVPGRDAWPPDPEGFATDPSSTSMSDVGFGDEPAPEKADPPHAFDEDDDTPEWLKNDPEFGEEATTPDAPVAATFPTRQEVRDRYEGDQPPAVSSSASRPFAHRKAPSLGRVAVGLIAITVLGTAAWWFWTGGSPASLEADVVVEIPAIAPSLQPVFRTAHRLARAELVDSLVNLPARHALADEPDSDWLSGRYMATAGGFDGVRLYWETFGRYEQIMRAREEEIFLESFTSALDTVPLPDDDRAAVEARAVAIFRATSPEREAVYAQLRSVVDAALSLHLFLEQNEDNIVHEPAGGLSRDPVLEAVPITEALGEEMWNRVADITSALDALGFLDRVTTDRLLEVFFAKLDGVVNRAPPSLQASK